MTLLLSDEQEVLRASLRKAIDAECPTESVQVFVDSSGTTSPGRSHDGLADVLASQMGVTGIGIPGSYGGADSSLSDLAVVMEELGRSLAVAPFLSSTVLGAQALLALDDESARAELLPAIAQGTITVAVALRDDTSPSAGVRSTSNGLSGSVSMVLDGAWSDLIIVEAIDDAGTPVFHLVDADATGLVRTSLTTADPTRAFARLDFDAVPSRELAASDSRRSRERIVDHFAYAVAAEQLGGIERCVEITADYATLRYQFGRPIGSYQGVKHRLADMYVVSRLATALVRDAGRLAHDPAEFSLAARSAFAYTSRHYLPVARDMIQLHGGIAYTWEHVAHLYYKRARVSSQFLGGHEGQTDVVADLLGYHDPAGEVQ
ncbi:acyl-CoA dehydrogenase family protein [Rhodococcus artemisiae]|uniref:Acyl-CoA dehydrogenase family protein n=1 Tax=Rhodococcus artemisiae TaxID=714159 RepID=A0ABU7LC43_9NOCA|nr:acyl-CoA dehydrogenase family protein [Rhodococcus artemisiae]MEE2059124.1 acyl-CoA dehydrogenase family protein [Rhodococcus artemisiae]